MFRTFMPALCCAVLTVGGCAQLDAWTSTSPPRTAQEAVAGSGATTGVYVNTAARPGTGPLRNIYIVPPNLANMQVIQPEGSAADAEWWVTDEEAAILQRAIAFQYSLALGNKSAFNMVNTPREADLIVNTSVIAVHPYEARASAARQGEKGGAITASIAVVNAASNVVLVRAVETAPSTDIWALNQVQGDVPELDRAFYSWGERIRQGLLELQGRNMDPALR